MRPDVCTLPGAELPSRLAEFEALFATARVRERVGPTRLRLVLVAPLAVVRDLVARESRCCSFFDFGVTYLGDAVELSIAVPASRVDVLDALAAR